MKQASRPLLTPGTTVTVHDYHANHSDKMHVWLYFFERQHLAGTYFEGFLGVEMYVYFGLIFSHVQRDMSARCRSRTPCFEKHLKRL